MNNVGTATSARVPKRAYVRRVIRIAKQTFHEGDIEEAKVNAARLAAEQEAAAKMMSRMQAMLFAFKSMPAHFVIKGFSKMLGITDAELKEALNKSLRRK